MRTAQRIVWGVSGVLVAFAACSNAATIDAVDGGGDTGAPGHPFDASLVDTNPDAANSPDALDAANAFDAFDAFDANGDEPASSDTSDASDASDAGAGWRLLTGYSVLGEVTFAFSKPYALAVDSTNHLFVSEQTDAADTHTLYLSSRSFASNINSGHSRILKFDSSGTYLGWIGGGNDNSRGLHAPGSSATAVYGYDPGVFNMIRGMAFDGADHLYVLDNWRIQELDQNHTFVRWAGRQWPSSYGWHTNGQPDSYAGPNIGGFTWGGGLRIHGGKFWVGNWFWNYPGFVNGDWNNVSALDMTTGLGVGWLGGARNTSTMAESSGYFSVGAPMEPRSSMAHSSTPGVFCSPRHFAWRNNLLYVVDTTSDPVLSVFNVNGVIQTGRLNHLTGAGEKPFAIAVDKFGNVIISDMYTGSVRFFSSALDGNNEFTQVAAWQVDSPSVPNSTYPIISDFAWDANDNLYVAATTMNKVYKIRLTY